MPAELHYAADIGSLCRRREIADGHVLDHTATERAHLGHLGTSCPKGWAVDTLILADRRRLSRPLSSCRDSAFVVCRECSADQRCKSSSQTDGGEVLAMRKGYRLEAMSEGSAEQTCELMDKNRIQGASVGRAGNVLRSPYPSRTRSVDPATVHGRRLNLPREICSVSHRTTTSTQPASRAPSHHRSHRSIAVSSMPALPTMDRHRTAAQINLPK